MKLTFSLCLALAYLTAPALAIPITVTIVGPDNKPLASAKISVLEGKFPLDAQAAPREIAGENGRFNFDWDGKFAPLTEAIPLSERLFVRAWAPGMTTQFAVIEKDATVIALKPGRVWGGLVLDREQHPIAGASVAIDEGSVPQWKIVATTDADGRWKMDDLARDGELGIQVSAPNYIAGYYALDLDNDEAPPLFLKRGAQVRGQIVTPAGQPIAGVSVMATQQYRNIARTDAEGRFVLDGVEAGEFSLIARDQSGDKPTNAPADIGYIIADRKQVKTVSGEVTDIGQWKATKGVVLAMRALDSATGQPVENASFGQIFTVAAAARADAQGQIRARVVPDDDNYPYIGSVSAPGYIAAQVPRRSLQSATGQVDLGTIPLERGNSVKGVIKVQNETPQNNRDLPVLTLGEINQSTSIRFWGDTDAFQTENLKAGNYKLAIADSMWSGNANTDWQLVSPQKLTVPAPGAASPPVEIIVRRLKSSKPKTSLAEARGQLLDENGAGIGGATINAQWEMSQGSFEASAITDNRGNWTMKPAYPSIDVEVTGVERPGYLGVGKSRREINEGVAVVSGLSMKRSGAVFAGRVVDGAGKGVAGAWIAVAEIEDYPLVRADENGQFQLIDVPLESFTLLAAGAGEFARQSAESSAKNAEIKLKPQAPFDREFIVSNALAGDFEWWRITDYWDVLGDERMGELANRAGENRDWSRYRYALELAERAPQKFGAQVGPLTEGLDDEQKAEIEAMANWAFAKAPDPITKLSLNNWVDAQKAAKRAIDAASVLQLLRVAAVAHRLGRDDANDLSDYAAAIAAQLKPTESQAQEWGEPLAKSGYAAAQSFVEEMKPIPEFKLWWLATGKIADAGDIAGAQKALARMETLAVTPEWIELAARESWNSPNAQVDQMRAQIARARAQTDVAQARELAAAVEEQSYRTETEIVIADRAIKANNAPVAEAALRVAMQSRYSNPENFALAASLAQQVSPQLGAELWADAFGRAVPDKSARIGGSNYRPSVAMWAFYHARLDAAQSRILLEREWSWRLPAAAKADDGKDEPASNDVAAIGALVMAMAVVDPARALEMRLEAQGKVKSLATQANVGLAAALLMSEEQRVNFGVGSRLF